MATSNVSMDVTTGDSFGSFNQLSKSVLIASLALVLVSVAVRRLVLGSKHKLNVPPMPKGLPIVGTMYQTRGPKTHRILLEMSKTFGSLFCVKTGFLYIIVVTSSDIAYEALIEKGQVFSSRPKALSRLNFTGFRSVNSALYGPYWRGIRKNLVTQVLSASRVASFRPFRDEALDTLVQRLREQAKKNDNVVPVLSNCRFTVFSILLHVCFSKKFDPSMIEELDRVLRRIMVILAPQVIDFMPFLQNFNKQHKNECQALLGSMRRLFTPLFEEHRELRNKGTPVGDYVDSLIVLQKEMNLAETDVLGLTGEVLAGGTDTTANTLEWTMGNLLQHPEIQERVYEEIKSVAGRRTVTEEDVEKMPYMQAVVKEALRKHPPLPFALTHGVTEQTKLRGYDIPEDSMVLFHIQAMQNDPEHWDHPEVFNPERFLTETPNPDHDMTGSHGPSSMNFIPFGAGRRICPGMSLGLKHVHLILARLIQTFEWSTVNPGEDVDFSERLQSTIVMSNPLHARIRERSQLTRSSPEA